MCLNSIKLIFNDDMIDMHSKVQGFGLILRKIATIWFLSLKLLILCEFELLIKSFIEANSK